MPKADASDRAQRQASHRAGLWAESWAALLLLFKGYRILARRYVVRGGEIDLVARRGDTVVFVEVKARTTAEAAMAALTQQKRRRIERAAAVWLARHRWASTCNLRGDAILVLPGRWPVHLADAFPLQRDPGH